MIEKEIINRFFKSRMEIDDRYVLSRYRKNNRIDYDYDLILKYVDKDSRVLDLGCGTGIVEEKLINDVAFICAIDKYAEFLDKAYKHSRIQYKVASVDEYLDTDKYNAILVFGVIYYMNDIEVENMLENSTKMLNKDGVIIIKGQWGIEERVIINKYSEELESDYYAEYRKITDFVQLLETRFQTQIIDIYPKEMSRWNNTHEYAIVIKEK